MNRAFMSAAEYGLCTEAYYPTTGREYACCGDSRCQIGVPGQEGGGVQGFCNLPAGSATALQSAVAKQPIAVGLALPADFMRSYKGGVYSGDCGERLNEAALLVGYGSRDGQEYWKVKFSRGTA